MLENVAPDLVPAEARVLAATQGPLAASAFGDKASVVAWRSTPSWYVVSSNDRVVNVQMLHDFAKTMKARTTVLQSSHMSLLSHPVEVAAVIEEAVAVVAGAG